MENENFEQIEQKLKHLAAIKPNQNWAANLKSALLTKATETKKPSLSYSLVLKLAAATAFILVFLVSGTIIYAQNSLPGDILYPIKRGYENIRLVFTNEENRFNEQQKLAEKRIDELKKVVLERNEKSSDFAIKEVRSSVQEIKDEVNVARKEYYSLKEAGKDTTTVEKSLSSLVPVLEEKQNDLNQIEDALSEPKQPQIRQLKDTLGDLQQKIENDLNLTPKDESVIQGVDDQPEETQKTQPSINP
ncbi:MAG TPA: DUF5667 domain-containing protein [Candidatus Nanoarchaeia archaeon]